MKAGSTNWTWLGASSLVLAVVFSGWLLLEKRGVQIHALEYESRTGKLPSPERLALADGQTPQTSGASAKKTAKTPDKVISRSEADNQTEAMPDAAEKPAVAASITSGELFQFKPYAYPRQQPHYEGEKVEAYVRVSSSGTEARMGPNQMGEYPRVYVQPGETASILLAFTATSPSTPIAVAAQDGGLINGGNPSSAISLDARKQLAFSFTPSQNAGVHRVSFTTPEGEAKTLDFWAGPEVTIRSN